MAEKKFSIKAVIGAVDKATAPVRKITTNIVRSMKRAGSAVKRVGKAFAKIGLGVAALGVAAGVAAFKVFKFVDGYAARTDELSKFSRALGFSIETLQELRFAAERTGVGANVLQMSLEKLNKNLGDTKADTGSLTTLLKKVDPGLLKVLKRVKSTEVGFGLLIDKMRKLKDPMRRASLASAAFGKGGLKIIRFLDEGVGGFAALRKQARQYGLVTTEGGKRAEAFGDSMANLKQAIKGVKRTIGDSLLPVFRPMIEKMTKWISNNRKLMAQKVAGFVKGIIGTVKEMGKWWEKNKVIIQGIFGLVGKLAKAMLNFRKLFPGFGEGIIDVKVDPKKIKLTGKLAEIQKGLEKKELTKEQKAPFLKQLEAVKKTFPSLEIPERFAPGEAAPFREKIGALFKDIGEGRTAGPSGRAPLPGPATTSLGQELKGSIFIDFGNIPEGVRVGTPTSNIPGVVIKTRTTNVGRRTL